jgi:hypothetical protein
MTSRFLPQVKGTKEATDKTARGNGFVEAVAAGSLPQSILKIQCHQLVAVVAFLAALGGKPYAFAP